MTTESAAEKSALNGVRTALGVGGVIALIAGALIVWQPQAVAIFVGYIIAFYAIAAGLVYAGLGIFSKQMKGWSRVGHIALGVLFIVGGIWALVNVLLAVSWLAIFLAILVGILWIVEGIVSLTNLGSAQSKGWSIFFSIISIVAGIFVLFSPFWAAALLWLLIGISLIVLGIIQIVRAFTFKG